MVIYMSHFTPLAILFLAVIPGFSQDKDGLHLYKSHFENVELLHNPQYLKRATGKASLLPTESERTAWPFDLLSIGHSIASYQSYGWNSAYFHHGLDIRGDAGTPVLATRGGKVVNVGNYGGGNRLYWEVAILDEQGFVWQYHHIDHESIPEQVKTAFTNEGSIAAGTKIGEIVDWPVSTFGERYHHVHLNVLGEGSVYLNPFQFLEFLPDEGVPEIQTIGLINHKRKIVSGNRISGNYALYIQTRDLILHSQFHVPPYSISYKVDKGEWVDHWTFNQLPGGSDREAYINDFYLPNKTCGDYRCRRIYVDLGFQKEGRKNFTSEVGSHVVQVRVSDYRGNDAISTYGWEVVE